MTGVISFIVDATGQPQAVSAANPLPVVAGAAGFGPVWGPDATGVAPTHPPVLVGGITNGGVIQAMNVDAGGHVNVVGSVASGVADSGNPVKIGGVFNNPVPTFSNGQRGDIQLDSHGNIRTLGVGQLSTVTSAQSVGAMFSGSFNDAVNFRPLAISPFLFNGTSQDQAPGSAADGAIVKPYAFRANDLQFSQNIAAAGTTVVFAAAGAGLKNFITAIQLDGVAAGVATLVQIKDGATVIWSKNVPAGASSIDNTFPTPLQGSANTAMNVTTSAAGPVNFNAQGYKG